MVIPVFVVLDTNHFAEMVHDTDLGNRLYERFATCSEQAFTTIILPRK